MTDARDDARVRVHPAQELEDFRNLADSIGAFMPARDHRDPVIGRGKFADPDVGTGDDSVLPRDRLIVRATYVDTHARLLQPIVRVYIFDVLKTGANDN